MRTHRAAAVALTVFSLISASSAIAADRGFYLGASAGQSSVDTDIDFDFIAEDVIYPVRSSNLDRTDVGFSVFGGYRFFRYLAVEAEYVDLGRLSYTALGPVPGLGSDPFTLGLDVETKGFGGSVLGILPLATDFELFGRAGFLSVDSKVTGTFSGGGFSDSQSSSDNLDFVHVGVGAALNVRERWTFRLEIRALQEVDDEETTFNYTSLAFVYRL